MDKFLYKGKPVAKPRMTRADSWKKRPCVLAYWDFKDAIVAEAKRQKFELGEAYKVTFHMEMPQSWSKKKKDFMRGKPHKQRPDIDNMLKALNDCLLDEDSAVHYIVASKKWSRLLGRIEVENYPKDLEF